MTETTLLEPSFADVAMAIERAVDLPAQIRSHWLCSLRQIAKAMDKPRFQRGGRRRALQ